MAGRYYLSSDQVKRLGKQVRSQERRPQSAAIAARRGGKAANIRPSMLAYTISDVGASAAHHGLGRDARRRWPPDRELVGELVDLLDSLNMEPRS